VPLENTAGRFAIAAESLRELVLDLIVPVVTGGSNKVSCCSWLLRTRNICLFEHVLIQAALGKLFPLVGLRCSINLTDSELEITLVISSQDDVKFNDIALCVGRLAEAAAVVFATGFVVARLWLGVRVSTQAVVSRRVYSTWAPRREALLAIITVSDDISGFWSIQVAMSQRRGGCTGEEKQEENVQHVGSSPARTNT
jgi:hypothetical protein